MDVQKVQGTPVDHSSGVGAPQTFEVKEEIADMFGAEVRRRLAVIAGEHAHEAEVVFLGGRRQTAQAQILRHLRSKRSHCIALIRTVLKGSGPDGSMPVFGLSSRGSPNGIDVQHFSH